MLGLEGIAVPLGLVLTLFSAGLCIFYGIWNWNKEADEEESSLSRQSGGMESQKMEEVL